MFVKSLGRFNNVSQGRRSRTIIRSLESAVVENRLTLENQEGEFNANRSVSRVISRNFEIGGYRQMFGEG